MATRRGATATRRFIEQIPDQIRERVLPGAARAGAKVIAQEARDILGTRRADGPAGTSVLIADAVKVRVRKGDGRVVARVMMAGPGAYVAGWLEYGTAPHFISVDSSQRAGRTAGRINAIEKSGSIVVAGARRVNNESGKGSIVIGGQFVGTTVHHPGARPTPFLRPALDRKGDAATDAAQAYINAHVTRAGIRAGAQEEDA